MDSQDASEDVTDSAVDQSSDGEKLDVADASFDGCATGTADEQLALLDATYCGPMASVLCSAAMACGCGDLEDFPDKAACESRWRAKCYHVAQAYRAAMDQGILTYCPGPAQACIQALSVVTAACREGGAVGTIPQGCVLMLSVNTTLGDTCPDHGWGCDEGKGYCSSDDGTCVALPGLGESCDGVCEEGLVCNSAYKCAIGLAGDVCVSGRDCDPALACVGGKCGEALPAQGTCTTDWDCRAGLACQSGTCGAIADPCTDPDSCGENAACVATRARVCKPARKVGEPCLQTEDCVPSAFCDQGSCALRPGDGSPCGEGVYCAAGLACGSSSGSCGSIPGLGDPCALGPMGPFLCEDGLACLSGTCASAPGLAKPCGDGTFVCADGLGCEFKSDGTNVCVAKADAGAPCSNDSQCQAGTYCEFSTLLCTAVGAPGTPCDDGNECGPLGSCVAPEPGSPFVCVPMPGLGDPCFSDCAPNAVCHPVVESGTCAPPVCSAITY